MELKIGDKVKINTIGFRLISQLHGMEGQIVGFGNFIDGTPNARVNFGFQHELFHDLDGLLEQNTGRDFGFDKLEVVKE